MGERVTQLGSALGELADIVDELEDSGAEVVGISTRADADEDGLRADLQLRIATDIPAESRGTTTSVEPDDESSGDAEAEPGPERSHATGGADPDADEHAAEADQSAADRGSATPDDEPGVACRHADCEERFDTEHGMKIHYTKVHVSGAEADDVPPHCDPVALREAYEANDSFAEMREALGTDVSTQTIRRRMMEHGIHDPGADETGPDATAETDDGAATDATADPPDEPTTADREEPVLSVPDGELPGDLTVADVRDAVEDGSTLYEVQQALDLDREPARDLLARFDLLELVHGRVATRTDREARKAEIEDRIRANAADGGTTVETGSD